MIVGLDVGFGYTKTVTGAGVDVSPSVVGEWMPGAFRLGVELGDGRDAREPEAIGLGERTYVVGERALRIAHRRFVGLSREWMEQPTFRVLALAALHRVLGESGHAVTVVTGLPVEDVEPHGDTVRRQLEGAHELRLEPDARRWTVTIERVHVLPQPLGTVLAQCLDSRGHVTEPAGLDVRVGVLDVGFRTTDYFTLDGLEVLPARCLTRNTGMADLLLDLAPRGLPPLGRRAGSPCARRGHAARRPPDRRRRGPPRAGARSVAGPARGGDRGSRTDALGRSGPRARAPLDHGRRRRGAGCSPGGPGAPRRGRAARTNPERRGVLPLRDPPAEGGRTGRRD